MNKEVMKETPIFEEVFTRLPHQPRFWQKVLIGCLLSFLPIVNLFAFGYLYRFALEVRRSGRVVLPEWDDWQGLFLDGLRFAVVWLLFWLLPILLAYLIFFGFGIFLFALGGAAYLIVSAIFVLAPVFFASALYRLQTRSDFKDLLDLPLIARMTSKALPRFILPVLVFIGIFALFGPMYGFSFFPAFLFLLAYSHLTFRSLETRRSSSL